jgi:hypothetical protein
LEEAIEQRRRSRLERDGLIDTALVLRMRVLIFRPQWDWAPMMWQN